MDDAEAYAAVEGMIHSFRVEELPPAPDDEHVAHVVDTTDRLSLTRQLLVDSVVRTTAENPGLTRTQVIGVLRSVLGSMVKVSFRRRGDRLYLRHIERFLVEELGIDVREVSREEYEAMYPVLS